MLKQALKIVGAILYTIRPSATLGACLLVIAAYQPQSREWGEMMQLILCTFAGSSYCFIVNDIFDRKKDLLNDKFRPIARGTLSVGVAWFSAVVMGLLFIVCAYAFGGRVFSLALLFIVLASMYSYLNIKTGLLANAVVAFIVAGTQWGVMVITLDADLIIASLFLLFFTIPREMLLDWLDAEGDKEFGKQSLAINFSPIRFKWLLAFFLIACTGPLLVLVAGMDQPLPMLFFIATLIAAWGSFIRFFRASSRKSALFGVRFSHLTFACFIVAMLTR